MFQKTACLAFALFIILGYQDIGIAMDIRDIGPCKWKLKNPPVYAQTYVETVIPVSSVNEESDQDSQNEGFDELEKEFDRLMEEMKRLGKQGKERLRKDILPRIRREIEKFRKKLEEYNRKDEEPDPIEI